MSSTSKSKIGSTGNFTEKIKEYSSIEKKLRITSVGDAANIVLSVLLSNEVIRTKGKRVEMLSKVQ